MKQLTCEMCGSTDILKQDGIFVCQACGCKYSIEEAKKLLVEVGGVVNVQGTVQVDRLVEIDNRLKNALAEYKAGNFARASAMFNDVLNIDYENLTAIIYKTASDGWGLSLRDNRIGMVSQEMSRAVKIAREKYKDFAAYTEAILPAIDEFRKICGAFRSMCAERATKMTAEKNELMSKAAEAEKEAKRDRAWGLKTDALLHITKANNYVLQAKELLKREIGLISENMEKTRTAMALFVVPVMGYAHGCVSAGAKVNEKFVRSIELFYDIYRDWSMVFGFEVKDATQISSHLAEMKQRVAAEKKKEKEQRFKAFWEKNVELQQTLMAEQTSLQSKKEELENRSKKLYREMKDIESQLIPVSAEQERENYRIQRDEVAERISKLNMFQRKEKNQQKELMVQLSAKISELDEMVVQQKKEQKEAMDKRIEPYRTERDTLLVQLESINNRLQEIHQELVKDR